MSGEKISDQNEEFQAQDPEARLRKLGIEPTPDAYLGIDRSSGPSKPRLEITREHAVYMREKKAQEANDNRSLLNKMLGKNTVTEEDIAIEEANAVNQFYNKEDAQLAQEARDERDARRAAWEEAHGVEDKIKKK